MLTSAGRSIHMPGLLYTTEIARRAEVQGRRRTPARLGSNSTVEQTFSTQASISPLDARFPVEQSRANDLSTQKIGLSVSSSAAEYTVPAALRSPCSKADTDFPKLPCQRWKRYWLCRCLITIPCNSCVRTNPVNGLSYRSPFDYLWPSHVASGSSAHLLLEYHGREGAIS